MLKQFRDKSLIYGKYHVSDHDISINRCVYLFSGDAHRLTSRRIRIHDNLSLDYKPESVTTWNIFAPPEYKK